MSIKSRKHSIRRVAGDTDPRALGLVLAAFAVPAGAQATQEPGTLSAVQVVESEEEGYKADVSSNSKLTAPLVDTPKSVTVVTQQVLEETGARSIQDALRTVPGITFGQGEGGTPTGDRPFIRGYDSQSSVYIDGLRDPGSQSRDVFNVEQVEVTKGSDSTVSGSGSTGGSLNLATKQARLGNSGAVDVGLGTARYKRVTGDLNIQVGDSSAVRINALREDSGVAGRDAVHEDRTGAALSFNTGLDKATLIGVDLYTFKSDGLPDYGIPFKLAGGAGTPNEANGLNSGAAARETVIETSRRNFYGLKDRDFRRTGQDSGTLRLEHRFDEKLTVRNRTRFTESYNAYIVTNPGDSAGWYNADPTPGDLTDYPIRNTTTRNDAGGEYLFRSQKNRNVETRSWINQTEASGEFSLGGLRNSYSAGVELSGSRLDSRGYTVTGNSYAHIANPNPGDVWNGVVGRATAGTRTDSDVQAVYAFDTVTLTEQWLLNLGLRYDHFKTHQRAYNSNGAALTAAQEAQDIKSDADILNYQAGVVFKPLANGSIYFSYATSATPSGFTSGDGTESAIAVTNKDLDPEETRSLELGTKWELLDYRLALTAALFDMKKTNAKVTNDLGLTDTVGEQRIKGVEIGASGAITDAWNISAGYTYLDSELVDVGFTCTGTPAVCTPSASNGKRFANTPRHSATLWTTYNLAEGLQVGGGASYMGKVYADPTNLVWLPSYTRLDALVSYQINDQASVRLNVNNLTDKTYFERPQNPHMAYVAPGRQFILTGSYRF